VPAPIKVPECFFFGSELYGVKQIFRSDAQTGRQILSFRQTLCVRLHQIKFAMTHKLLPTDEPQLDGELNAFVTTTGCKLPSKLTKDKHLPLYLSSALAALVQAVSEGRDGQECEVVTRFNVGFRPQEWSWITSSGNGIIPVGKVLTGVDDDE
jgi:hypothetical protein